MNDRTIERKNLLSEHRRKAILTEATRLHEVCHAMEKACPSVIKERGWSLHHKRLHTTLNWVKKETVKRERQLEKNR